MPELIKGDTVMLRRGKERGKRGVVKAVFPRAGTATVEGLNVVKRHTKQGSKSQNMGASATGGILEKESPLPLSALQYVCEKCKRPTRLHHHETPEGTKRICAKCGEPARLTAKGVLSAMAARLKEKYEREIRPALRERFGYRNVHQIPKLEKVVVNMSVGEAIANAKALDAAVSELQAVTGQKPVITKAKKSIAAFKLREGMNIGAKVTLRGERMYVFLDKLFNIVLPRIRDFRGLPRRSFDGRGNYNLGLREQIVFPEINFDKVDKARGMDIVIVTTAKNDEEATEFLSVMGLPLQRVSR